MWVFQINLSVLTLDLSLRRFLVKCQVRLRFKLKLENHNFWSKRFWNTVPARSGSKKNTGIDKYLMDEVMSTVALHMLLLFVPLGAATTVSLSLKPVHRRCTNLQQHSSCELSHSNNAHPHVLLLGNKPDESKRNHTKGCR